MLLLFANNGILFHHVNIFLTRTLLLIILKIKYNKIKNNFKTQVYMLDLESLYLFSHAQYKFISHGY